MNKLKVLFKRYIDNLKYLVIFASVAYLFVCYVGMNECMRVSDLNKLDFKFTWHYKNMCYFKRDNIFTTLAQEQDMLKEKQ